MTRWDPKKIEKHGEDEFKKKLTRSVGTKTIEIR